MSVLIAQMLKSERQVIARLPGTTKEELFWARVDIGKEYLATTYGANGAKKIQTHKEFWVWWRWIWHDNDLSILEWMIEESAQLEWEDYLNAQLVKAMRMEPPKRLLKDWLKEA